MKKIVSPNDGVRLSGYAESDGVIVSATHPADPFGFLKSTTVVTVNNDSEIECFANIHSADFLLRINHRIDSLSRKVSNILVVSSIFTFIALLASCFSTFTWILNILISVFFVLFSACWLCKPISIFVAKISGDKEIRNFSKYLSAKNAVFNAYYDSDKVPTIEEAKQYSVYEPASMYIQDSGTATFFLSFAILHFLSDWRYLITALIVGITIFYLYRKNKLFFWQFLIVSKPDGIHYQAAITALTECLELRDSIQIKTATFEVSEVFKPDFSEEKCAGCPKYDFCKGIVTSDDTEDVESLE